jgi:hypothetical protein
MPTKTWYINQLGGDLFYDENITGVADTTSVTGWTVGKIAAGRYSNLANGTERATGTFGTTILPNNTAPVVNITLTSVTPYTPPNLLVSNESITTVFQYTGVFPAGTWTFNFPLRAVSAGGVQDGRMGIRVFKALRSGDTFSGTTELTSARLVGTTVTNLTTTVTQTSTVTWSAPAFRLENEYLIIKMAWEITGAGNANAQDVLIRFGPSSTMISPDFKIKRQSLI